MTDTIYILTNPAMPDLVKIGVAADLEEELRPLNSRPEAAAPFKCHYRREIAGDADAKRRIALAFGEFRADCGEGFFRIDPEKARTILQSFPSKDQARPAAEGPSDRRQSSSSPQIKIKIGNPSSLRNVKITVRSGNDANPRAERSAGTPHTLNINIRKTTKEERAGNRVSSKRSPLRVLEGGAPADDGKERKPPPPNSGDPET